MKLKTFPMCSHVIPKQPALRYICFSPEVLQTVSCWTWSTGAAALCSLVANSNWVRSISPFPVGCCSVSDLDLPLSPGLVREYSTTQNVTEALAFRAWIPVSLPNAAAQPMSLVHPSGGMLMIPFICSNHSLSLDAVVPLCCDCLRT